MSSKTSIEWTDATWNPIRGCSRVSEGCRYCYAEQIAARFSGLGQPYEGLAKLVSIVPEKVGDRLDGKEPRWTGEVRFIEERLSDPLHWRKPRRIFVNSMSDLFHEKVKTEWIDEIFAVMSLGWQHAFQILTKRPERMREYFRIGVPAIRVQSNVNTRTDYTHPEIRWPLPNVWLGVSVEDQKTADDRIPLLLQTPAAVRWVSYEPALGPVDFMHLPIPTDVDSRGFEFNALSRRDDEHFFNVHEALDWIVAGGESGPGARPAHPDWFRSARNQCAAAGVPFFFKQWGEFSQDAGIRVGKKAAGRLLDGIEHSEYPLTEIAEAVSA